MEAAGERFRRWTPRAVSVWENEQVWERRAAETRRHMTQVLGNALELRDPTLKLVGHCARVAVLACSIAETIGVQPSDIEALRDAAELHEIGIISVPVELLLRPGPLTPAELERVRAHAWVGAEIVRSLYSPVAARLVEHQYEDYVVLRERERLTDRELLLAGILRVADVFDAVTVPRPYQIPLSAERRTELLRMGAALKFHPIAASAALHLQDSL